MPLDDLHIFRSGVAQIVLMSKTWNSAVQLRFLCCVTQSDEQNALLSFTLTSLVVSFETIQFYDMNTAHRTPGLRCVQHQHGISIR